MLYSSSFSSSMGTTTLGGFWPALRFRSTIFYLYTSLSSFSLSSSLNPLLLVRAISVLVFLLVLMNMVPIQLIFWQFLLCPHITYIFSKSPVTLSCCICTMNCYQAARTFSRFFSSSMLSNLSTAVHQAPWMYSTRSMARPYECLHVWDNNAVPQTSPIT